MALLSEIDPKSTLLLPVPVATFEDGGSAIIDRAALLNGITDPDPNNPLQIEVDSASLPAGVVYHHVAGYTSVSTISYYGFSQIITVPTDDTLTLDASDPAYQALAAGEERDVIVNYQVSDGTLGVPGQATFRIFGTNDAPVIAGPVTVAGTEAGAPVIVSGLANATDVDHGSVLTVVAAPPPAAEAENFINAAGVAEGAPPPPPPILPFDPATLPAGVTFDAANNSFILDPSDPAYRQLAAGQTVSVTVNYGVSDGTVATAASAVFTVTGTNQAPVVNGPATGLTVSEGGAPGSYQLSALLANVSDPDPGDKLTVSFDPNDLPSNVTYASTPEQFIAGYTVPGYTIPAHPFTGGGWNGYVVPAVVVPDLVVPDRIIPATTTLTIDPSDPAYNVLAEGEVLDVVIPYHISDGTVSVAANAIIHVVGTNDAPIVAGPVSATVPEGATPVTVQALATASDVDQGAVLSVVADPAAVALPAPGSVIGTDAEIEAQLEAQIAAAGTVAAQQPFDPSTLPAGVTFDQATNSFRIDPSDPSFQHLAAGATQTVTVKYGVSDGSVATSASVVFTVVGTNDAPVVSGPVAVSVIAQAPSTIAAAPVLQVEAENENSIVSLEAAGVPAQLAANSVMLLANATDPDDGAQLSVTGLPAVLPPGITHYVTQPYYTPSTVYYGAPVFHPGIDALSIDPSDPSFKALAAGETETITVAYGVTDGTAVTPATAVFTVTGINDAPVVSGPVTVAATEDGTIVTASALANAADADNGAVLTVINVPAVLPAGVSFDAATQSFSIDPANAAYQSLSAGQTTQVAVSYAVTDGIAVTPGALIFTVTGTNDTPVAGPPQTVSAVGGSAAFAINPLAGATDPDQLDVLRVVGPLGAGVHQTATGFSFDPNDPAFRALAQGETGTYTWNYDVSDGLASAPASMTFIVAGVNDAPTVPSPVASTTEGGAIATIDALSTAIDPDHGAVLSVVNVPAALPAGITYDAATHQFHLDPTNAVFQSLGQGQTGTYTVNYGVTDGIATTAATAVFNVTGVNNAPVITAPMTGSATEDGALARIEPLLNVTDVDSPPDALRVINIPTTLPPGVTFDASSASHQMFKLDPTNAAYQSLSAGETMTVSIPFAITDGYAVVPATATFTVTGKNDAPVVTGTVTAGTVTSQAVPVTMNLLATATDIDHLDVLTVATGGGGGGGGAGGGVTATVTGATWSQPVVFSVSGNQLTIDPKQFASLAAGKTLGVTFNYQVTDGHPGGTAAASATVSVQGTYTGPTGVAMADATASLAKAQAGGGINAKAAIASFTQTGGLAADSYTYALGGAGAAGFTMASSNGVGTLSAGNSPVAGASAGKLYALAVTATDATAGLSTAAAPVDVVVGLGSGSNTINLATLGIAGPTPTFVYDLGGSDRIDASAMTGKLWIDGGQGADTMTGGSGANTYLYGATNESTATAMDIIANFHAGADMIDFTGLGTKFAAVNALSSNATTIAGSSIGWQTSGSNTFLYVNTSGNSQSLGSATMKVELMGSVPLTGGISRISDQTVMALGQAFGPAPDLSWQGSTTGTTPVSRHGWVIPGHDGATVPCARTGPRSTLIGLAPGQRNYAGTPGPTC